MQKMHTPTLTSRCQLKRPMVLRPSLTLGTRIRELDTASSEIAEELDEPFDSLSQVFPQQPPLENLHIIVKLGAGECGWLDVHVERD